MAGGSVDLVNAELERFLTDPTADALALSGDWGSGKTFAWNAAVDRIKADTSKKIARPGYAYVSLFGIGSIAQLNVAIFQHSDSTAQPANKSEKNGFLKLGRLASRFRSLPGVRQYAEAAEELMSLEIRDRIVCFDDLERMSPNLKLTEVLGLASFLKERRNCKIVFIAHTDKLEGKEEFDKLSEKVIDISLRFVRMPEDSAAIAIADQTPLAQMTRAKCIALGISNIRVIRQTWRLARALDEKLTGHEPSLLQQGIHSVALFGWCHFQPKVAPDKQLVLKTRGDLAYRMDNDKVELTDEQKEWVKILDRYDFGHVDEFDAVLAKGVEDGYFDPAALKAVADQKNALAISEKAGSSVHDAWATFHHSLGGTEEQVASAIHDAVKMHAKFVTPMNLDGAVRMMKELGFPQKAKDLLVHYVASHEASNAMFDLDSYTFSEEVRDPDVIAAFNAKFEGVPDARDPLDVLIGVSKHGTGRGDWKILRTLTAADLIAIFKRAGPNTRRVINACLENVSGNPESEPTLPKRAREALIEIGRESLLNRLRVKRYGITDAELDAKPEDPKPEAA